MSYFRCGQQLQKKDHHRQEIFNWRIGDFTSGGKTGNIKIFYHTYEQLRKVENIPNLSSPEYLRRQSIINQQRRKVLLLLFALHLTNTMATIELWKILRDRKTYSWRNWKRCKSLKQIWVNKLSKGNSDSEEWGAQLEIFLMEIEINNVGRLEWLKPQNYKQRRRRQKKKKNNENKMKRSSSNSKKNNKENNSGLSKKKSENSVNFFFFFYIKLY